MTREFISAGGTGILELKGKVKRLKINLMIDVSIGRFVLQASQIVNRIAESEIRLAFLRLRLRKGEK